MTTDLTVAPTSEPGGFVKFANLPEAIKFAEYIAKSDLVPKAYQHKPADIVIAMQMGMELGFTPLQALQVIAVIGGRPGLFGDGIPALIIPHPQCEDFQEVEPTGNDPAKWVASCTIIRRGKSPVTRTYTVEDAKKAGLWGKAGPWTTHPKRMLQMRARGFASRDSFPDVLKGIKLVEELWDIPPEPRISAPRRIEPVEEAPPAPEDSAPTPGPPTVKGDQTATKLYVNDYVCLKDDRGMYYRITTNDGDFYTRDEPLASELMKIHGEERTFTATYRQAKVESGEGVRALVSAVVDPPPPVDGDDA